MQYTNAEQPTNVVNVIRGRDSGFVYVLYGYYSDRSGGKLFGVYDTLEQVEDRKALMEAANSAYTVTYRKMKRNAVAPMDLF